MSDPASLYERDFYAWTQDQAEKLRAWPEHLRPNGVDIAHLVEEIEELTRSEERALTSLLFQLFLHLLRLELPPDQRNRQHWAKEVNACRTQILRFGDLRPRRGSPKLWAERGEWALNAWHDAFEAFLEELRIAGHDDATLGLVRLHAGGEVSCYRLDEEALKPGWYPEHRFTGTDTTVSPAAPEH